MRKIPITPQMLRKAVEKLQKRQLFVRLKNLRDYMRRYYPVEQNLEDLEQELQKKLDYAVCVGLLVEHGDDQYRIPTLREEANAVETAISAFWKLYYKNNSRANKRKRKVCARRSLSHQEQKYDENSSTSNETNNNEDFDFLK